MADYREQILARLVVIAGAVGGVAFVGRNKPSVNEPDDLPAIVVYDGNESADEDDPAKGRAPANAPRRVHMMPSIEIVIGDTIADAGTKVNSYRALLLNAIFSDATLLGLVADGRGIRYLGAVMGSQLGRSMEANMMLNLMFTYRLYPGNI